MAVRYRTIITDVGQGVPELLDGGVLILFADGAPPELAEMSILHVAEEGPTAEPPARGAEIRIGLVSAKLTAIGDLAWKKVSDLGHVVINFDGSPDAARPGELCATPLSRDEILSTLVPGAEIAIID